MFLLYRVDSSGNRRFFGKGSGREGIKKLAEKDAGSKLRWIRTEEGIREKYNRYLIVEK